MKEPEYNYWNAGDLELETNTSLVIEIKKMVDYHVGMAVQQAIEEDGSILVSSDRPGIEICFISWEMPIEKRERDEDGKVTKCSFENETTLRYAIEQSIDMYWDHWTMTKKPSDAQYEEAMEYCKRTIYELTEIREMVMQKMMTIGTFKPEQHQINTD